MYDRTLGSVVGTPIWEFLQAVYFGILQTLVHMFSVNDCFISISDRPIQSAGLVGQGP